MTKTWDDATVNWDSATVTWNGDVIGSEPVNMYGVATIAGLGVLVAAGVTTTPDDGGGPDDGGPLRIRTWDPDRRETFVGVTERSSRDRRDGER